MYLIIVNTIISKNIYYNLTNSDNGEKYGNKTMEYLMINYSRLMKLFGIHTFYHCFKHLARINSD